jgi:hypothetical protein
MKRLAFLGLLALLGCGPRHAPLSVTRSACLQAHYSLLTGDEEILDRLGYCGPNRGVIVVGATHCYSDHVLDQAYPQPDLRCLP